MAKILTEKRVIEYSKEFKFKVIELTNRLNVKVVDIAEILELHPVMIYRWRQEHREGKIQTEPTRRIGMEKKKKKPKVKLKAVKKEPTELERLKKENARLSKENDFLKKWQRYLSEQKKNDSPS
ncbi:MAG: transposase [Gammaproteobacteria bacterium]|nr:transposase [Gammaproteobacteria bacterium]